MSNSTFKYGLKNSNRGRWRALKNKGNDRNSMENLEFQILNFQKEAGLKEPYGVKIDKFTLLEALFGANPFQNPRLDQDMVSSEWDYMVVNIGYEEDEKKARHPDSITSIIRLFKGIKDVTEEVFPQGGGGDGQRSDPIPPPLL